VSDEEFHVVTGAFGYSGKYITRRLLNSGIRVRTLTGSRGRENPFEGKVDVHPFHFDNPDKLTAALEGATVLYNTYWVRFNSSTFTFAGAIKNSETLFKAAKKAGVRRIVHTSITNPSEDSPYEYFSGKAKVEKALEATGVSHSILRPALLFGRESILINNIAWLLRKFPVFFILGDGRYRLQPIFVDDFAGLAVEQGTETANTVINAIGPETFAYRTLVQELGRIIGKDRPLLSVPPRIGYWTGRVVGCMADDVFLTWDEISALQEESLYVEAKPAGQTKLTLWAREHADFLGRYYQSEMRRRLDRVQAYVKDQ
jgi:NADH dehydrogenase